MDWILIGLGAGLGSVARYEIGRRMAGRQSILKIPGTFVVNLTGAFLLGLVVAMSAHGLWWSLLADGFLGGFTTFSTLMVETVVLIRGNRFANGLVYLLVTFIFGITAFLAGEAVWPLISSF